MTRTVWLEVALNGPWGPDRQPNVPVSVEAIVREGIDCAKAGAAIIHVHARDPETGRQRDDASLYARIIEGIRAEVDCIVYPTVPLAGAAETPEAGSAEARYAHVAALAERGLLEWAVVDPGSVQLTHSDNIAEGRPGFLYQNPERHVRYGLELAARFGFHPGYAIYEPGFVRLGARLAASLRAPSPIYRLMFSDGFTFGFPPQGFALEAYLGLLELEAPKAPWMIAGLAVDVLPLIGLAVERGGHVRVGLEDAPFGDPSSNRQWTERAVRAIEAAGGRLATPGEVRQALGPDAA